MKVKLRVLFSAYRLAMLYVCTKNSTILEMWSRLELLCFELWLLSVTLTFVGQCWNMYIVSTRRILGPSFKIIFQGFKRYGVDTKSKCTDRRTDRRRARHNTTRPRRAYRKGVKVDFSSYCTSCAWFISSRQAHILNEYVYLWVHWWYTSLYFSIVLQKQRNLVSLS